ncbi:aminoacyl-histidine dipeptidase [Faecalimonas sp.]
MALENLEPKEVFHYFEELTRIPRGTYNTKAVSDYCVNFAKELGLEYIQDQANNVIIKKAGTKGYEESEPVIIQGHLDMVCEKIQGSTHDFMKDPLDVYEEDGFVQARGTTLGGDDGIAIAYAMAILASNELEHPPIEAVFTVDEEEGMGGANAIDLSVLKGRMLLNLDSDVEGTIVAGCEGGCENVVRIPIEREEKEGTVLTISVDGLRGGHSGLEIHEQHGNANKLMGRLLMTLAAEKVAFSLVKIDGGSKPNVITSFGESKIVLDSSDVEKAKEILQQCTHVLKDEFGQDEPDLSVIVSEEIDQKVCAMTTESKKKVIFLVTATPDGVQCFSRNIKGLVETSLNLGIVKTEEEQITAVYRVRSAVKSKKENMKKTLAMWAEFLGGTIAIEGEYPAWAYKIDSKIRPIVVNTYKELFGTEPKVTTIHAGLECGLFAGKLEDLDCVSLGPEMLSIHSPNEKLNVASTQRTWELLKAILKNCK